MQLLESKISGCYELLPIQRSDSRGVFIKTFNYSLFREHGLHFDLKEQFFSYSSRGVIRGMHFQVPDMHNDKIVFCPQGEIFDVIVDMRVDSPTYGEHVSFVLSPKKNNCIYIPEGVAHGFQSLQDNSIVIYNVSSEYSADHDDGIMYDSIGIDWPIKNSITISERDKTFKTFNDFNSPFKITKD